MKVASASVLPLVVLASASDIILQLPGTSTRDIDPNFLAFGFEEASFVRFVLDNQNNINTFSVNLLQGITNRTGGQAIIRIGGTSADYAWYNASQTEPVLPVAELDSDDIIPGTSIGPSFWQLTKLFAEAAYMVQVPLATTDINETVTWVQTAIDNMNADQIFVFEIGNEPDWYSTTYEGTNHKDLGPPFWQGKFTNETYVSNYTQRANAIVAQVSNLPAQPIFQAFDTAARVNSDSSVLEYDMAYDECFPLGIDAQGYIKTVAQHYYQNKAGGADSLADGLMNLTWTHARMDYLRVRINYLEENNIGIPFVLSEAGNSLGAEPAYQTVLGSALWLVDFYLYALTLGVQRVHYQQMVSNACLSSLWLPVSSADEKPQVYSNYYALILVGEFIGNSGSASMAQIDVTNDVNVSAYAAFENGVVKRVAIVNMEYWNLTSSGHARPSANVSLELPSGIQTVTIAKLTSPWGAGSDATSITYGGSQWTYESQGFEVSGIRDDTETIEVSSSSTSFAVDASSAVLITLVS